MQGIPHFLTYLQPHVKIQHPVDIGLKINTMLNP